MKGKSLIASMLSACSAMLALAVQVIIASKLGATYSAEVLASAGAVPLAFGGGVSSILSYVLPRYLIGKPGEAASTSGLGSLIGALVTWFPLVVALGVTASYMFARVSGFAIHDDVTYVITALAYWLIACFVVLNAIFIALHVTSGRYVVAPLVSVLPHLGCLIFTLAAADQSSAYWIPYGTLAGQAIATVIMSVGLSRIHLGSRIALTYRLVLPVQGRALFFAAVAVLSFSGQQVVDSIVLARLGDGTLALSAYAHRIWVTIGTIVVIGPSAAASHLLTEAALQREWERFTDVFEEAMEYLGLLGVPAAIFISARSQLVVSLAFERGAFSALDSQRLASSLPFFMFGMYCMMISVLSFRALFATASFGKAGIIGCVVLTSYSIASMLLAPVYGLRGVGLAFAASSFAAMIASLLMAIPRRELGKRGAVGVLARQVLWLALPTSVVIVVLWIGNMHVLVGPGGVGQVAAVTVIEGIASVGVFWACAALVSKRARNRLLKTAARFRDRLMRSGE